jgi:hydrogenase maturation protein HypF
LSTEYGQERSKVENIPFIQIQHHFAHAASLLGEHQLFSTGAVIFAADGLGYGTDSAIWGGEFLLCVNGVYQRISHWDYTRQPGGDVATKSPWRMVVSYLISANMPQQLIYDLFNDLKIIIPSQEELKVVIQQCIKKINAPLTSSTGRFLDAIAVLLGPVIDASYEGEPAITLESCAWQRRTLIDHSKVNPLLIMYLKDNTGFTHLANLFCCIVSLIKQNFDKNELAYYTLHAVSVLAAKECIKIASTNEKVKFIGITGGVAYNDIITSIFAQEVLNAGYQPLMHEQIPPGDGGIATGQCFLAVASHFNPIIFSIQ